MTDQAREAASEFVYRIHDWRGRSPEFMQAQVGRLAEIIQRENDKAYSAGLSAGLEQAAQKKELDNNPTLG